MRSACASFLGCSRGVVAQPTRASRSTGVGDLRRCSGDERKVVWRRTEGASPLPEGGRDMEIGSVRLTARVIDADLLGSLLVRVVPLPVTAETTLATTIAAAAPFQACRFSPFFPALSAQAGSSGPLGGVFANTKGGRKALGRRWRRTEGDRKVFAAGEPTSRIQSTRRQTPQTDLGRRPEGGWKVGGWYRRRCEGARLRR